MNVKFMFAWFGPDAILRDPKDDPIQFVPDEFRDQLPSTAIILDDEPEPKVKRKRKAKRKEAEQEETSTEPDRTQGPDKGGDLDALLETQENEQSGPQKARDAHNAQAEIDNAKAKAARAKARAGKE